MATIETGGAHGRKKVDHEIPLVPFVDLLLCCLMFLLVTAVWAQLGSLGASTPGGHCSVSAGSSFSALRRNDVMKQEGAAMVQQRVAAGQQEDGHCDGDFHIYVVDIHRRHVHALMIGCIPPHHRPHRPTHRRNDSQRNECVHGGGSMSSIHGCRFVEWSG